MASKTHQLSLRNPEPQQVIEITQSICGPTTPPSIILDDSSDDSSKQNSLQSVNQHSFAFSRVVEIDVDMLAEPAVSVIAVDEPKDELENERKEEKSHSQHILQEEDSNIQNCTIDRAQLYLKFAEAIKKALPAYSLSNILCGLQKETANLDLSFQGQNFNNQHYQSKKHLFQKRFMEIQDRLSSIHMSQVSQNQQEQPPKMGLARERQLLEREVSNAFILYGYDHEATVECINQDIQLTKYNSVLTSIMRGVVRKLCDIMNRNLGQNIKEFDIEEERILKSPLINYKKWLTIGEQKTLFKIMKIVYSMNQEPIYQDEVLAFYDKVLKQLHKRNIIQQERIQRKRQMVAGPHHPPNFNKFQTVYNPDRLQQNNLAISKYNPRMSRRNMFLHDHASFQGSNVLPMQRSFAQSFPAPQASSKNLIEKSRKQIAELYSKYKNIDEVILILSKKYHDVEWTQEEIERTIATMIRLAIKRIFKYRTEYILQKLSVLDFNISEAQINLLIASPIAQQSRQTIVKSLLQQVLSVIAVNQLINIINLTMARINQQK